MKIAKNTPDFFGLDIGTTAVRAVQMQNNNGSHILRTYGSVDLPDNTSVSDSPQDMQKLSGIIKQLISDLRITTNNVVAGLPSQKVFSSILSIPKVDEKELSQAIQYQADQYIPMPVKDAKFDWIVLNDNNSEGQMDVLLIATQKKNAENALQLLESVGLNVIAIEPDAMAVTRSVVNRTSQGAVAIMDVGANSSDIVVAYNRNPWVIRSIPVGGMTLIKAAAQNLNVDLQQAEQFVHKFGMTQTKLEGQVYKALKPSVDSLTDEISKSVKFFGSHYQDVKLEKLILTGGISGWPDFPLYIADTLNMPVEIGNSWINVSYSASQQNELMNVSSRFAVVNGLAQR